MRTLLERQIGRLSLGDQDELLGFGIGMEAFNAPWVPLDVLTYEVAMGMGRYRGLDPETIIKALQDGKIDGYTLNQLAVAGGGLLSSPSGSTGEDERSNEHAKKFHFDLDAIFEEKTGSGSPVGRLLP